ncbi:uncharacterized protein Tco025E_09413 [Trypanosoma conorhini]|uniref:Mucin-like glycoprotein n=1 Tax=Trypanosoma conorhini TaxID=83891 RepID=A0A3R7R9W7_9TRYP|nr:uncharacterized protein Tco025E_09413 [Trypanosoma conorhini]RNE98556.1 hypothetical protein Tco025E_09413 [Trypanosoma conorhini]
MVTTLAVRRRAVCGLALLALLCGCCAPSFVCAAAAAAGAAEAPGNPPPDVGGKIFLPVDVACELSEGRLRWRLAGEEDWENCTIDASEPKDEVARLCDSAAWLYGCWNCTEACAAAGSDAVAFTMKVAAYGKSQLYNKSLAAISAADFSFSDATGVCALAGVNKTGDGCNDEKLVAAKPPAPAAARLTGGTEAQQQGAAVEAKSEPQLQEEGRRDTENIAAGAERGNAAVTTAQEPAGPAPPSTAKPSAESASPLGGAGGQPAHTVKGAKQVDESVRATEVPPKPNAQPQAGGGLAQGGVDGATGQPNAEKSSEEAGGVAERQATTEHGSESTALLQPSAGAETIAGPQPPESTGQTQGAAAAQSSGHPDIGSAVTSGPAASAGSRAGATPHVPYAGGVGVAGDQTGEPNEANAEVTAEPDAARAAAKSEAKTPAARPPATSTDDTATTTGGDSGSPAAQPQPASSVAATVDGDAQQKEKLAVPTPKQETETSGERGEAAQPAAGAAAQAAATTNSTSAAKAAPGDSDDSSTATSHSASLFAVLLLLAYAAAAAVVAA